ncbi:hypothetical protein D3C80_2008210 [compost metagenome]
MRECIVHTGNADLPAFNQRLNRLQHFTGYIVVQFNSGEAQRTDFLYHPVTGFMPSDIPAGREGVLLF